MVYAIVLNRTTPGAENAANVDIPAHAERPQEENPMRTAIPRQANQRFHASQALSVPLDAIFVASMVVAAIISGFGLLSHLGAERLQRRNGTATPTFMKRATVPAGTADWPGEEYPFFDGEL
jgi:hypothetical protein